MARPLPLSTVSEHSLQALPPSTLSARKRVFTRVHGPAAPSEHPPRHPHWPEPQNVSGTPGLLQLPRLPPPASLAESSEEPVVGPPSVNRAAGGRHSSVGAPRLPNRPGEAEPLRTAGSMGTPRVRKGPAGKGGGSASVSLACCRSPPCTYMSPMQGHPG